LDDMRAAGASRIVAVVKEELNDEVESFRKAVWSEDIYVDAKWAFYNALGGGTARKPNGMFGFLAKAIAPSLSGGKKLQENLKRAEDQATNFKGEGFVTGGLYVLKADGSTAFSFSEHEYGDRAEPDAVIEAIKIAAASE